MSASPLLHPAIDTPLAFVDLETTGGSAAEHRITEIGVVVVNASHVSTWTTLVDPRQPIPPFIQQLTGITDAMVRGAPTFADIASALFERLDGKLFVAHNVSFDRGFLRAEFERAGVAFNPDVLCTVRLSRALFPRESRHGLDA
ncbi:3'-5' exonuclease, partial [Burkholderia humptydooensis]